MAKKIEDSAKLSREQIRQITEVAARVAIEKYTAEQEQGREERKDRRLYNTKLLMEKYRGLVEYSKNAVFEAAHIDDDYDLQSLLELMQEGNGEYTLSVESIKKRAVTARTIIHHVDKMLDWYKTKCKNSRKIEIMRRYEVIEKLYINDSPVTVQDLADELFVDVSTIYKYNRAAMIELSALFFGYVD